MTQLRYLALAIIIIGLPSYAVAQEYFGQFLDKLNGTFNVQAEPRPTFTLKDEFRFDDPNGLQWTTPAGTEVNGASIPQAFWPFIGGPFEGKYINASVIHDHYCRTKTRTAHDTHRNFYYGMRASGVPQWKATLMHWVVATFGPDWKLTPRVSYVQDCFTALSGAINCSNVPKVEVALVSLPSVDLSDPEVLALAISKATAVARTLRTSNGTVLDILPSGEVPATADNILASSEAYRQVFTTKKFYSSQTDLGLLANVASTLTTAPPWAGGKLPKFSETWVLTPRTADVLDPELPFKIDARSKGLLSNRVNIDAVQTNTTFER